MSFIRWTLATLVVLAFLVAASLTAEPGVWREAVHWARGFRELSSKRAATCPVLVGESVPGDPREAYELIGQRVIALDVKERAQLRAFAERRVADPELALALVAKVPVDSLEALRQLVRMDGKMYSASNLGLREPVSVFGDQHVLIDALLVLARYATTEEQRMHAWLDAIACGLDLAGSELPIQCLYGLMIAGRVMDVADDAWVMRLSLDGLRVLGDALAKVDAATPVCVDLQTVIADLVLLVDETDDLQPVDVGMRSIYQSWQNAFSVEDEAIERVSRTVEQVRAFLDGTPSIESWASRRQRLQQLVKEDAMLNADLMSSYLNYVFESEQGRREFVINLRLLRMVITAKLGEELVLADPLGEGAIGVAHEGGYVRFFSAGGAERRARSH